VPAAVLRAASIPERVAGLVLCDPFVACYDTDDSRQDWVQQNERTRHEWGTPLYYRALFSDEHEFLSWFVPWCRASVAPGTLVAEADRFGAVDVRGVLSSIQVPTLVIGRQEDAPERESTRPMRSNVPSTECSPPCSSATSSGRPPQQ
jgi:pimeloyl-ACP methyl ester carboxylesterase